MEKAFIQIIEKVRKFLMQKGMGDISLDTLETAGISKEEILKFVDSKEELVERVLEFERDSFIQIFLEYNFEGQNAIDILFIVSQEINDRFVNVSPSVTMEFEKYFPEIYKKHMDQRMAFIFDKIQINVQKGVAQGMYREDLSPEIVGRMYLSRLEDMHNPELYPPDRFKFGTIYDTMIDSFVKSIATEDGLTYYRHRKQLLSVLSFGR
ncbi:TetR/AcrR family transcriptional regulator [Ancylomarina sp. DW003]|nr:TetR/AcrR family transcriptional regulator [Ancylomarina sp. DW003]MDE5420644.1 TetR/AcrR family transcriptional regulator [Ancylomarina sp. DW003]